MVVMARVNAITVTLGTAASSALAMIWTVGTTVGACLPMKLGTAFVIWAG